MSTRKKMKIKKVLSKYNYWRKSLGIPFVFKKGRNKSSECQVACHSDPCSADPTCSFD